MEGDGEQSRLEWGKRSKKSFMGLIDLLKGVQSPEGTHLYGFRTTEKGGNPKDIKILKRKRFILLCLKLLLLLV